MKFGEYLQHNIEERWKEYYLDYGQLKKLIKALSIAQLEAPNADRAMSLSFGLGAQASAKQPHFGDQAFIEFLESEMRKINEFTVERLADIRAELSSVERQVNEQVSDSGISDPFLTYLLQNYLAGKNRDG